MIINDLTTKYTLANNWILRTDPYYESRKYSVYDITSRLTLYVTRSCYTLLKIFHDKALSFSSLYEAIEQKNIKNRLGRVLESLQGGRTFKFF